MEGRPTDSYWRPGEPGGRDRRGYLAMAACRRGHIHDSGLSVEPTDLGKCPECGADFITRCLNCGIRLRGMEYIPGIECAYLQRPYAFCDGCGAAHPWATRAQRLYELQNILDQQDIDDADRLWINEQFDRLRAEDGELSERQQKEIWSGIKRRAPELFKGAARAILSSLISMGVKSTLGL